MGEERMTGDLVAALRDAFGGRVLTAGDSGYDQARATKAGGIDNHPMAIAYAADAEDVRRVVTFVRETGVPLAVRSGGHSLHSTTDGGLLLDLSGLKSLEFDVEGRTAWAGSGLTAGEFTNAAAAHGLAVGFGDTGSVGLGGITTGGGVGFLARKHGLTVDALIAADVVTADGSLLRVDEDNHPDLFWALRGGGGNFGVVTRFRFRLQPVDRVVAGMLMLPATAATIEGWMTESAAAPEELSNIANVMNAPPMPFVPEQWHGKLVIMGLLCFDGPAEEGERVMAPFRALAEPIADFVKPMPYPEIYGPEDDSYHPIAASQTLFIDEVDKAVAETIVERLESSDAMMRAAQLRVLGGAVARVPASATAYAHRSARVMVNLAALCATVEEAAARQAWIDEFAAAIDQGTPGGYVGFVNGVGEAAVRRAYPAETYARLAAVKATYDPTNLFRLNHNVPPAAA
jgi:FAD/FMN-containing dehydrogenase